MNRLLAAAALFAGFFVSASATSAVITYRVTATVTELDLDGGEYTVAIGDELVGTLTVNLEAADGSSDPLFGDYADAVTFAQVSVRALLRTWGDAGSTNSLRIQLADPIYGGEFIDVVTHRSSPAVSYAVWALQNIPDADRLTTDSLPFPVDGFGIRYIDVFETTSALGGFRIRATPATWSVVPIPAAVWLLGSAVGLLAWLKRRATQCAS
jgi:hypothetical protein